MFTMNMELTCSDGGANNALGAIPKFAYTVDVGNEKKRPAAMKDVRRARTEEVEGDGPYFPNEHDEVCNETFPSFIFLLVDVVSDGTPAGTGSLFNTRSKN